MSRWLQQQVQAQHPDVEIIEVLEALLGVYKVSASTCQQWIYTNSLTHTVLRDPGGAGSIAETYGLSVKDIFIVDRYMKIVFKSRVTTTLNQNQVLGILGQLQ